MSNIFTDIQQLAPKKEARICGLFFGLELAYLPNFKKSSPLPNSSIPALE